MQGKAFAYTPSGDGWSPQPLALPQNVSVNFVAADTRSNRFFLEVSTFLSPTALWLADSDAGTLRTVKTLPPKFDASSDEVEQFEATSSDGTGIPYFVVHRKDAALDGSTPTLMTAYGGFQVSRTPRYLRHNRQAMAGTGRRLRPGKYPRGR